MKMTARQYQKKHTGLLNDLKVMEMRIGKRLLCLCEEYPEAPIEMMHDTIVKAKSINSLRCIENIEIDMQIIIIERIETWLEEQHPHKQLELFNKETV